MTTQGLYYPLSDASLRRGTTLGISNGSGGTHKNKLRPRHLLVVLPTNNPRCSWGSLSPLQFGRLDCPLCPSAFQQAAYVSAAWLPFTITRIFCRFGFQVRGLVFSVTAVVARHRTLVADNAPSGHVSNPFMQLP